MQCGNNQLCHKSPPQNFERYCKVCQRNESSSMPNPIPPAASQVHSMLSRSFSTNLHGQLVQSLGGAADEGLLGAARFQHHLRSRNKTTGEHWSNCFAALRSGALQSETVTVYMANQACCRCSRHTKAVRRLHAGMRKKPRTSVFTLVHRSSSPAMTVPLHVRM